MPELKITELPVSELVEYENNAKLHPHEQVDQIAQSIQEFGNNDPIAVWHNEQGEPEIVEGHGRLMALRKLGIETAPVIVLDHLSDEQRRAYALVHNKLTMNSDFDTSLLDVELGGIFDINMYDFGFDIDYVNPDDFSDEFSLPTGEKSEFCTMTFSLHEKQKELIEYALQTVEKSSEETFGNTNRNGNALFEVVRQWVESKKLR